MYEGGKIVEKMSEGGKMSAKLSGGGQKKKNVRGGKKIPVFSQGVEKIIIFSEGVTVIFLPLSCFFNGIALNMQLVRLYVCVKEAVLRRDLNTSILVGMK